MYNNLAFEGIRSSRLESIRRLIAQTYGYEHLFTVHNLERAGLVRRKDSVLVEATPSFHTVRKQLKLIDDRINVSHPDDISYVCAGYAPLSVRLVQVLGVSAAATASAGARTVGE